jgi:hypothetical protein
MRARGSKSGVKNETPKLPEPREYLGKIGIFLHLNSNFPHTKFDFLQRLSDYQEIQENILQQLSDFREIQENLFTVASIQKITI